MNIKIPIFILLVSLLLVGTASATTFYLRDIPATGVVPNAKQSADTITDDFATTNATYAAPAQMLETAGSGTFSNTGTGTSTADLHYTHYGTWVTNALAAQTVDGTVTIGLSMLETNAKQNLFPRVKIYRWYANDTYASDLLALTDSGTEVGTTASLVTYFSTTAITSRTFDEGDRIVIEIEDSSDPTETAARIHTLQYGGAAAGAYGSYVTFSDTITYPAVAPVAAFSGTPTSGDAPLEVTFTDASTNTPTNWDWYMWANETKTSDDQNPVITFTTAGTYNIRLYASNSAGGDWENKTGYITSKNANHYSNWTDFYVNSTSAQTDYQVKMILDNRTGSSTTTLFYTNGTTRSDWIDVAWTDTSNATLGFWKENRTDTATNTTWWIKVPSISNDNTTKIRLFYGNASETTSYMSGNDTFEFFDDFEGSSLNMGKWTKSGTVTITVSNSTVTFPGDAGGSWIKSIPTYGTNYTVRSRFKANLWSGESPAVGFVNAGTTNYALIYGSYVTAGQVNLLANDGTGAASTVITMMDNTSYKVLEVKRNSTTSILASYNDTTQFSHSTKIPAGSLNASIGAAGDAGGTIFSDWIVVRKSTMFEPFLTANVKISGGVSAPVASFTKSATVLRIPKVLTVTDTSTNTPTSWEWSWGDGTANSTTQNPTHQYTKRGIYTINLAAINAGGTGVATAQTVRVVGYENLW